MGSFFHALAALERLPPSACLPPFNTQMRALIAFLGAGAKQLSSLRVHLPFLLQTADEDKDEWVQVVSGLVRRKLLPSERDATAVQDDSVYSTVILRKTVAEVLARADGIMAERGGNGEAAAGVGGTVRPIREASYFGPLEERYVSRKQQPPREEFANAHFSPKYEFVNEFSEDLAPTWLGGGASNTSTSPTGGAAVAAAVQGFRAAGQGGLLKAPGSLVPPLAHTVPVLAQARRVSLAATDPAAGSDGLRRISKPLALSRNHPGLQPGTGGPGHQLHLGSRKSGAAGGSHGVRGRGGGGGGKVGLMMINEDELQAIDADKVSAKERSRGKPGRKKAKVDDGGDEQKTAGGEPTAAPGGAAKGDMSRLRTTGENKSDAALRERTAAAAVATGGGEASPEHSAPPDGPMPIPGQADIEAAAAMMVLGVAGGDEDADTSYLPDSLRVLLENANSLKPEGKAKLESFFQKKTAEGSPQERVKYHEDVSPGEDGELMRVTSYIRLDYQKWVWDRVHKKKRVKP